MIARHTRYVVQDYLLLRAALPVVLISSVAVLYVRDTLKYVAVKPEAWSSPRFISGAHDAYGNFAAVLLYFAVFLAVIAIMTVDRTTGHYRFFFSKPVNVVWYYVHTVAVHGAALLALVALFALGWSSKMPHESVRAAMLAAAIGFGFIGGIGFFLGALTNLDAALTPLAIVFAITAQSVAHDYSQPPAWLAFLARVLPPADDFEKIRKAIGAHAALPSSSLWHLAVYGGAGWLVGLVLLRRLSLAR
jgi:hypothetical protein